MSSRQPVSSKATTANTAGPGACPRKPPRSLPALPGAMSFLNFKYPIRLQLFQERFCPREIKVLVPRLDAKKETIGGSKSKSRHVEYGMVWRRQTIHSQHSENRGQSRPEDRQLKRDRNPCGPAIERF